jgi:AcrR family transcriptional regulator
VIVKGRQLDPRERIVEAMIDVVIEHDYEVATVEMVIERAGVNRSEFERHFADKQDCCIQIYEHYAGRFDRLVFEAYESEPAWRDGIRAGAYQAARFFRRHQRPLLFSTVGLLGAGDLVEERRTATMKRHVDQIDRGRFERGAPDSLTRSTAEVVVGSIFELIVKRLPEKGVDNIERLIPQLMYVVVRPYLGHEVAREELTIPPPSERRRTD